MATLFIEELMASIIEELVETVELKKWCIEQAQSVYLKDADGLYNQAPVITTAEEIYNWVKK